MSKQKTENLNVKKECVAIFSVIFYKYLLTSTNLYYRISIALMVDVVQLVERRIVVPVVVGSSPIVHPSRLGCSQVGKAPHFDCGIS